MTHEQLERERDEWKLRAQNAESLLAEVRDGVARLLALKPLTDGTEGGDPKLAFAAVEAQRRYITVLEQLLKKSRESPEWQERCRVAELTLAETREALAKVTRERDEAVRQRDELRRRL